MSTMTVVPSRRQLAWDAPGFAVMPQPPHAQFLNQRLQPFGAQLDAKARGSEVDALHQKRDDARLL